jgi:phage/plasmid primase-like uncharacterized protein
VSPPAAEAKHLDPDQEFRGAMAAHGHSHSVRIAWGSKRLQRFPCPRSSDKKNDSGFFKGFSDREGGIWGCHKCWGKDHTIRWQLYQGRERPDETEEERRGRIAESERLRTERRDRLRREQEEAAARAVKLWNAAKAARSHPYLDRKGITDPQGLKVDADDRLLVPMKALDKEEHEKEAPLQSLQIIDRNGRKRFLPGGRATAVRTTIGALHLERDERGKALPRQTIYVCEGWATGWSISEVMKAPVLVAFTRSNLEAVARWAKQEYPNQRIVIAADNDRWSRHGTDGMNPGVSDARAAAEATEALLAIPDFDDEHLEVGPRKKGPTDFNDLHQLEGEEAVRKWLDPEQATEASTVDPALAAEVRAEGGAEPRHPPSAHIPEPLSKPKGEHSQPEAEGPGMSDEKDGGVLGKARAEAHLEAAIEKMNADHFVTRVGGKTVVASFEQDLVLRRERLVYSSPRDIEVYYQNILVPLPDKGPKPLGKVWLEHRDRRTYRRVVLDPTGRAPNDVFNLWKGLGVRPVPGSWDTIRAHLLHVICDGDELAYTWLLHWLARCVQRPELRAEVAVVLKGLKGAGKGMLGRLMRRIFHTHFLQITQPRHLTGHFNDHLHNVLFLFGDEVTWGGDRVAEGVLKGLITEESIALEGKFLRVIEVPNRLKILLASNAEWVVPATADERRFFVLEVPPKRKGDAAYFRELRRAIDGSETPPFLHDLLAMDLSGFDHRNPPHTAGLAQQKLAGADSVTAFWHDCLSAGHIVRSFSYRDDDGEGAEEVGEDGWPRSIVKEVLHRRYVAHARDHGERRPVPDSRLTTQLKKLLPEEWNLHFRPRVPWGNNPRPARYALPDLATCREAFAQAMNIAHPDWGDDDGAAREDPELTALTSGLGEVLR